MLSEADATNAVAAVGQHWHRVGSCRHFLRLELVGLASRRASLLTTFSDEAADSSLGNRRDVLPSSCCLTARYQSALCTAEFISRHLRSQISSDFSECIVIEWFEYSRRHCSAECAAGGGGGCVQASVEEMRAAVALRYGGDGIVRVAGVTTQHLLQMFGHTEVPHPSCRARALCGPACLLTVHCFGPRGWTHSLLNVFMTLVSCS